MQAKPSPSIFHRFHALGVAIEAVEVLGPVVARIRAADRRFSTAAGSTSESRTALRLAVAWGHVCASDIQPGEELLDRVAAMLHRLGARY